MFTAEQRFNIEIKHYEKGFVSYGLLPTLLLLEQYEAEENYLECFYIKTAIDNLSKRHDQYFGSWFWANSLDVLVLATQFLKGKRSQMANFQLKTVAAFLGIEVDESRLHDAEYDIDLTMQIYNIVTK